MHIPTPKKPPRSKLPQLTLPSYHRTLHGAHVSRDVLFERSHEHAGAHGRGVLAELAELERGLLGVVNKLRQLAQLFHLGPRRYQTDVALLRVRCSFAAKTSHARRASVTREGFRAGLKGRGRVTEERRDGEG